MPIEDSDSEGASSSHGTPTQPARAANKRAASEEVDCITLDSDTDEEQVEICNASDPYLSIESGSGQKSESVSKRPLNPDPNPSCFLTLPAIMNYR